MKVENRGNPGDPLFLFETPDAGFTVLEAFSNGQRRNSFTTFVHASDKPVVLRDLMMGYGHANYRNTGKGELYVENVVTGGGDYPELGETASVGWHVRDQRVFARNWNPEDYVPDLHLDGATVSAIGGKLGEVWGTHLKVSGGSRAELFGFMMNTNLHQGMWFPERMSGVSIEVEDSELALNAFHDGAHTGPDPILVRETRDGETRELRHSDSPPRDPGVNAKGETVVLPLFRAGGGP